MVTEPDSATRMRLRMRRMVYTLFAVYWILVAACLVFPRVAAEPDKGLTVGAVVTIAFVCLLLIALAVSLALAYFSLKHRAMLSLPDLAMGLLPLAFSLTALISLWQLA